MKQTLNGKKCDICEDDYYFDKEGNCFGFNFCSKGRESRNMRNILTIICQVQPMKQHSPKSKIVIL